MNKPGRLKHGQAEARASSWKQRIYNLEQRLGKLELAFHSYGQSIKITEDLTKAIVNTLVQTDLAERLVAHAKTLNLTIVIKKPSDSNELIPETATDDEGPGHDDPAVFS